MAITIAGTSCCLEQRGCTSTYSLKMKITQWLPESHTSYLPGQRKLKLEGRKTELLSCFMLDWTSAFVNLFLVPYVILSVTYTTRARYCNNP